MTVDRASEAQAAVYSTGAEAYDELIVAEDADGALVRAIDALVTIEGSTIVDVGAGTGRFARIFARRARHVHLVDRAPAMLEVAKRRLSAIGAHNTTVHEADVRSLPLEDACADLVVAGWVFGHFPHWMPDDWQAEIEAALGEMRRVARPGAPIVVVETLGTGHETPRESSLLDPYFAFLESRGFARSWIRTDYAFLSVSQAAEVCGRFFGPKMAERIVRESWSRVPECTAILTCTA